MLDQDLARLSAPARDRFRAEHLGVVFQMFNLLAYANARDNVLLALAFAPERRRRVATGNTAALEADRLLARLGLLTAEAVVLTAVGIAVGVVLLYLALAVARPYLDRWYGLDLAITAQDSRELLMLALVLAGGFAAGLLPALCAYRLSLADGMTVRT